MDLPREQGAKLVQVVQIKIYQINFDKKRLKLATFWRRGKRLRETVSEGPTIPYTRFFSISKISWATVLKQTQIWKQCSMQRPISDLKKKENTNSGERNFSWSTIQGFNFHGESFSNRDHVRAPVQISRER